VTKRVHNPLASRDGLEASIFKAKAKAKAKISGLRGQGTSQWLYSFRSMFTYKKIQCEIKSTEGK